MYVVTVEFVAHKDHRAEFREAMLQQAENSLNLEQDCHQFDVSLDPENDCRFFLYEIYEDEPAFKKHLASDHFKRFADLTDPWVASKSVTLWTRLFS